MGNFIKYQLFWHQFGKAGWRAIYVRNYWGKRKLLGRVRDRKQTIRYHGPKVTKATNEEYLKGDFIDTINTQSKLINPRAYGVLYVITDL